MLCSLLFRNEMDIVRAKVEIVFISLQVFLVFNLVYDYGVDKNKRNVMSQSESLYRGSSLTTEILCTISTFISSS